MSDIGERLERYIGSNLDSRKSVNTGDSVIITAGPGHLEMNRSYNLSTMGLVALVAGIEYMPGGDIAHYHINLWTKR